MTLDEIKKIAKEHGLKTSKVTKGELVRMIQQAEGNQQCFDTNYSQECGQDGCLWRKDCH